MCVVCEKPIVRTESRGPIPKYCSTRCKTKAGRTPHRKEYERLYRAMQRRTSTKRAAYEWRYNRRPEVKARNRERMRLKWHTDEEYRQRQLERLRNYVRLRPARVEIPAPYSGHRWLDMARQAATRDGMVDTSAPWAEDRYDEMGEAVLALLEGRDMREAVQQYRKREYVARYLTTHWDDFKDDEGNSYADIVMPSEPSAEEEAIARETLRVRVPSRFYRKGAMSRHMRHRTQQPTRRRMKDGKSWQKHLARSA